TVTADATGAFSATFTVAADATNPMIVQSTGALTSSLGAFNISVPSLVVTPSTSIAGVSTPITVTGAGFAPSAAVGITFTGSGGSLEVTVTATTDVAGNLPATVISVPPIAPSGDATITATDSAGNSASVAFTVTLPPPPAPTN